MATYDDGMPENWYPGFFLDPRNAWKWMPSAIPGWLPPAMVRTPPATWPEQGPAPSGSSTPGLLDGLAELAQPKSFEEKLAEARKYSLIPDSLGGDTNSQPQSPPSSWLAGAQWRGIPTTAWPNGPATKSIVGRDDADLTPEMHRGLLDAYFRYADRKSEPQTVEEPAGESETAESLAGSNAPLFVQSGMVMAPPSGHIAPPSLDLSDPWAVAAYRTRQGARPTFGRGDPARTEAAIRAGLVSAADPFGIPSLLIGQVSPATKDLIREQYEDQPIPSMIGSLATSTPRSVVTAFEAAVKAAPKTMAGLLGLGGATFSADEAEAGKGPRKFGKRWWGRPSVTDKFWRDVPTKLDQPLPVQEAVWLDPATLRWSQRTAGGNGGADRLRASMRKKGYSGDPIDVVQTPDGLTTIDHTRPMVAMELGIERIPARVHDPTDLVPPDMYKRFGRTTWGQVLAKRLARQKPPLPPTGTTVRPALPPEKQ